MANRGRPRRVNCKVCGRHIDECGPLSARGLCDDDGPKRSMQQQYDMAKHQGADFKRWRARSIAALGVEVPDDLKPYLE